MYTSRAKDIKDTFQANHPEYVYTRRSSKKRPAGDAEGSSKKFKGSDGVCAVLFLIPHFLFRLIPFLTRYHEMVLTNLFYSCRADHYSMMMVQVVMLLLTQDWTPTAQDAP